MGSRKGGILDRSGPHYLLINFLTLGPLPVAQGYFSKRQNEVESALLSTCTDKGCQHCAQVLREWDQPGRFDSFTDVLRSARTQCYFRWLQVAPEEERCPITRQWMAEDKDNPNFQVLAETPEMQQCLGASPP